MLSLCLPYYRNPRMLAEQYRVWANYPVALKADLEVVLVDDGSPEPAADVARPEGLPPLRIYRVLEDRPWHQHGARNLAATNALGPWLLLTDMDHVFPVETLLGLFVRLRSAARAEVFTFGRRDAPDLRVTRDEQGRIKPHVNTFAMTKAHFWKVGGYDEACVGYGTDGYFRHRLRAHSLMTHLPDLYAIRYPREVIADASGSHPRLSPRAFRNAGRRAAETRRNLARNAARGVGLVILDFPWEQVL